jgi:hypothetical protein
VASYYKPATVLVALRGVLGEDTFNRAFREYAKRWLYKHPAPEDFFNTFENVSGQDLSWFWRSWLFETWKMDQAIDTVLTVGDSLEIVVQNEGRAPMPVRLAVSDHSRRHVVGWRTPPDDTGAPRACGEGDRDRSGQGFSRHRPEQSGVAKVGLP